VHLGDDRAGEAVADYRFLLVCIHKPNIVSVEIPKSTRKKETELLIRLHWAYGVPGKLEERKSRVTHDDPAKSRGVDTRS